jgi:hypothetical protein
LKRIVEWKAMATKNAIFSCAEPTEGWTGRGNKEYDPIRISMNEAWNWSIPFFIQRVF